jgi:biopolymer transport protein ExbD
MAMTGGKDDGSPMMEMNTTPLIDVMLVLLIMLIMTLPPVTNSVNIDLPSPSPSNSIVKTDKNKIILTPTDQIMWNGQIITDSQLVTNLQATLKLPVEPELQFEPDPQASYNLSSQVLNIIKASGVTKFGFVGNEQYRVFQKGGPANPTRNAG